MKQIKINNKKAKEILINEGITKNRIFITGNTIVDAVFQNLEIAKKKSKILEKLKPLVTEVWKCASEYR